MPSTTKAKRTAKKANRAKARSVASKSAAARRTPKVTKRTARKPIQTKTRKPATKRKPAAKATSRPGIKRTSKKSVRSKAAQRPAMKARKSRTTPQAQVIAQFPEPGQFCWAELATTDAASAKQFYAQLLGLTALDNPLPMGGTYTMLRGPRGDVGALFELTPEMRQQGGVPNWGVYVRVENVTAATEKAKQLGGEVLRGPMEVMEFGRMSVVRDPTGAVFNLWEAKTHLGYVRGNGAPGTVGWNELLTTNPAKAAVFYTSLFGWTTQSWASGQDAPYTVFLHRGQPVGGMHTPPDELRAKGLHAHWLVYFMVDDCDATSARVHGLGGSVCKEPFDVPNAGRIAVVADPQGAVFAVMTPERK